MSTRLSLLTALALVSAACGSSTGTHNSLVRMDDEPNGSNCATGGKAIRSGLDANDNATLEDAEVKVTSYVCNGATGANGEDGSDGENGFNGTNGSNGKDAAAPVIRTSAAPAQQCPNGGVQVDIGTDVDGDGTVEEDEFTTKYVCDGEPAVTVGAEVIGTYEIANSIDAALLKGVKKIDGGLLIRPSPRLRFDLVDLEEITGGLVFMPPLATSAPPTAEPVPTADPMPVAGPTTSLLRFSKLKKVGRDINYASLAATTPLRFLEFPELTEVVGNFNISNAPGLTGLSAPKLMTANTFDIHSNPALHICAVSSLAARVRLPAGTARVVTGLGGPADGCDNTLDNCISRPIEGENYAFCQHIRSWSAAAADCAELGGTLVGRESIANFSLLSAAHPNTLSGRFWFDLNDVSTEGTFLWGDGSTLLDADKDWVAGEPNNVAGLEDCAEYIPGLTGWNDFACTALNEVVCKLP